MALSPEEMQELAELEELEALEAEEAAFSGQRSPAIAPREPVSRLKSGAAGVAQGITAGYVPQIVGGLASGVGKIQDMIYGENIDPATGKAIPRADYVTARDATNRDISQAAQDNPGTYLAGNVAGAFVPGAQASKLVKGASAGTRVLQAGAVNAAQGALYNPGDVEGVVDPIQAKQRASNAALGLFLGSAGQGLGEAAKKGSNIVKNVRDLKTGAMADRAVSAIDDAANQLDIKQIKPKDAALRELIKGKQFEVNPDRVKPVFSNLGNKMAQKLPAPDKSMSALGVTAAPTGPARTSLSGNQALRLKRAADSSAGYAASKPFDPVASAKGTEAKSLADILRRQINADPKAAAINEEIGSTLALKDALLKREGTAPIEMLQPKIGTSQHAMLSKVDNLAGTNLRGLGEEIKSTKDLLIEPTNLVHPLKTWNEQLKILRRGAAQIGSSLEKLPAGSKEASLSAALEAKRRAK